MRVLLTGVEPNDLLVTSPDALPLSHRRVVGAKVTKLGSCDKHHAYCRGKPLAAKERTNNKLNPHMASTPGFEPGPHWWEASALTTAPPLLSNDHVFYKLSIVLCSFDNMCV